LNEFDDGTLLVQKSSRKSFKPLKKNFLPSIQSHSKQENYPPSRDVLTPPLSKNGNKIVMSKGFVSSMNISVNQTSNKDKQSRKNSAPRKINFNEEEDYSDFDSESIASSNPPP